MILKYVLLELLYRHIIKIDKKKKKPVRFLIVESTCINVLLFIRGIFFLSFFFFLGERNKKESLMRTLHGIGRYDSNYKMLAICRLRNKITKKKNSINNSHARKIFFP